MWPFKKREIKPKEPIVKLLLSEEGYYVVTVYGKYMTDTVTRNKEEADRHFNNYYRAANAPAKKHTVIKQG